MMVPDAFEGITEDVSQEKFFPAEEKIAGVDCTVRHHAQLRGPCRAPDLCKLWGILNIG